MWNAEDDEDQDGAFRGLVAIQQFSRCGQELPSSLAAFPASEDAEAD